MTDDTTDQTPDTDVEVVKPAPKAKKAKPVLSLHAQAVAARRK